ncbi:MAG: hypothetical protein FWC79_08730 [Oscillospiraceae bacterium]|nr:hypothetical protein [Oscillospiraceae bacterium]
MLKELLQSNEKVELRSSCNFKIEGKDEEKAGEVILTNNRLLIIPPSSNWIPFWVGIGLVFAIIISLALFHSAYSQLIITMHIAVIVVGAPFGLIMQYNLSRKPDTGRPIADKLELAVERRNIESVNRDFDTTRFMLKMKNGDVHELHILYDARSTMPDWKSTWDRFNG